MKRVVLVCPGRGTYTKSELGTFRRPWPDAVAGEARAMLAHADRVRAARGDETLTDLDAAATFGAKHVAGENAGALIYTATAIDAMLIDRGACEVVATLGNSMGWYTALHVAGGLAFDEGLRLADTMAGFQRGGPIGGQVIWPLIDDQWRVDAGRLAAVESALAAVRADGGEAGWSIRLGGFAVLYAATDAVRPLMARLPKRRLGERDYPFQLQGHAAFHSPLLLDVSRRAHAELGDLAIGPPATPLIDGRGAVWTPLAADPVALLEYTLGAQVTTTFDFTAAIRVALREYAPDHVVLLGPGDTLGGAIAHVMIAERWRGLDSRDAFRAAQAGEAPPLIAMARPDQAAVVSRA